jgi:hypothetical protein
MWDVLRDFGTKREWKMDSYYVSRVDYRVCSRGLQCTCVHSFNIAQKMNTGDDYWMKLDMVHFLVKLFEGPHHIRNLS